MGRVAAGRAHHRRVFRLRFDVDVLNLLPNDLRRWRAEIVSAEFHRFARTDHHGAHHGCGQNRGCRTRFGGDLRRETNLTESVIWQPAWLERPAEAAELIGYLWLNQPPGEFDGLAGRFAGTNMSATLAEAREQLATSLSPWISRGADTIRII